MMQIGGLGFPRPVARQPVGLAHPFGIAIEADLPGALTPDHRAARQSAQPDDPEPCVRAIRRSRLAVGAFVRLAGWPPAGQRAEYDCRS
jgi:hypothetical protein